jgi:hypothetical protein
MVWRLRATLAFVVLVAGVPPLLADEEYDRLLQSFDEAQQKWSEQTRDLKRGKTPPPEPSRAFVPKFRAYAKKHAGKPEAIPALVWLIHATRTDTQKSEPEPVATWAVRALRRDHAASLALGEVMEDLRNAVDSVSCEHLVPFYELVRKKNPDPEAKAAATFNLAYTLWTGGPGAREGTEQRAAEQKRAGELFHTVVKEYPDSAVAEEAQDFIRQLEHIEVGLRAPEVVGTDANEKEVRLSQFKGRVVVLLFWGFW